MNNPERADGKLFEGGEQFRHIFDNMLEGIQVHDFDWKYLYVNKALLKYSQYSEDELIGHTVMEKYPGIEQTDLFKAMERCMNERISQNLETDFVFPDGSIVIFQLSIQPFPEGIFILSIDITERKKADEKVKRLNESLEQKVRERTAELEATIGQLKESQQKFEKVFRASSAGISITRLADATYLDVNEGFIQMMGFSRDEVIGRTSADLGMIVSMTQQEEVLEQVRKQGYANFEMTVRRKSGRIMEVLVSIETIYLSGEKYAINIISDITERKKVEDQLKKYNDLFTGLFEYNPAAFALSNLTDDKIVNVNESFLNMFGFFSKDEAIGRTSTELNLITDPKQRDEIVKQMKAGNREVTLEGEVRTRQGNLKWVQVSMIRVEMEKHPGLLTVLLDITSRKKAEDQVVAINKELEAFTYSVSHDLRAPLRAVNGYAKMLLEDFGEKLEVEAKNNIEAICYNAVKMGNLIDDLLAFAKLGRKEPEKKMIDMNELVEGTLSELKKTGTHRAVIKTGKLHKIKADYGLLHQVVYNLLSNAIKYSSKKENPIVEIDSSETVDEIIFSIKDNGVGFDMKYYNKLFGVFQRLHSPRDFDGTGVGLAIVYRIIAKHGGKVWAEAEPDKGATFYFSLIKIL
jgi:PAS domain S-box-containing protein